MNIVDSDSFIVGSGTFRYQAVVGWPTLPQGWSLVDVVGVAVDSKGLVYVLNRGDHQLIVFTADGKLSHEWQHHRLKGPHGITVGADDMLYLCDNMDHVVYKFTPDGRLVMTLGHTGRPSDTGVTDFDYRTMQRPGPPFHHPTNLALTPDGEMFVTDGYGNARVHRFSGEGKLLLSWGEPGSGPGQFHLPHDVAVDSQERVFVADRENDRLQIFSADGEFLEQWTGIVRPCGVFIDGQDHVFVAEEGRRAGLFPWMTPDTNGPGGRASVYDRDGMMCARWGGGDNPCAPDDFFAPHDICVDAEGSIYVGEVTWAAGGNEGMVPSDCPSLRKYVQVVP